MFWFKTKYAKPNAKLAGGTMYKISLLLLRRNRLVWHASQIRDINYLMRSRRILDRNEIKKNSRSGENTLIKIFKSALFFQKLHFWDYKHNVTRVSDWENLNLASWRTVTNTRVMRNVLSAAVELGMSSHELKKSRILSRKETRDRLRVFFFN